MQQRNINNEFQILVHNKFNIIVMAAMEGDAETLKKVKTNAFPFPFPFPQYEPGKWAIITPFSITIDGHTPLSRLAFDGNDEAVSFLISHGGCYLEACIGYAASGKPEKCDDYFTVNNPDEFELLAFYEKSSWLSVNDENKETILQKNDYTINPADTDPELMRKLACVSSIGSALARKGVATSVILKQIDMATNTPGISSLFENKLMEAIYEHVGYTAGCDNEALEACLETLSKNYKSMFTGLFKSGHLIFINALLKQCGYFTEHAAVECLVNASTNLGYMHHPELAGYLQNAVNSHRFSKKASNIYKRSNVPITLFEHAANPVTHLNARYKNLSLNHFQLESLRIPGTIIWMLQCIQMVKRKQISMDIFIHILEFITGLSEEESMYLNHQIQFKYLRGFLENDIQKYTDGLSGFLTDRAEAVVSFFDSSCKKTKPHYDRAVSFLAACQQTKSLSETSELVTNQYNLFSKKIMQKPSNNGLHNEPYDNYEEDAYTHAIARHYERM